MKFALVPNGFLEIEDDRFTLSGNPAVIIPRQSVRSAVCRDGKKSWFTKDPPAVFEIEYVAGVSSCKAKLLVVKEEKARLCEALSALGFG